MHASAEPILGPTSAPSTVLRASSERSRTGRKERQEERNRRTGPQRNGANADESVPPQASDPNHQLSTCHCERSAAIVNHQSIRGGSGCANGGIVPGTGSRGVGRVGPSVRKITRARNQKRPGTSGGGRKQEGEALNRTPSVGIRLWAVCKRGSAHEPPPENVASARDVVLGCRTGGGYVRSVYAPEPPVWACSRAGR